VNRRRFLKTSAAVAGAGVAVLACDAMLLEPSRLRTTRHVIRASGADGPIARIVQLTDLHLRRSPGFHETIARAVGSANPDVIVISGDSVDRDDSLPLLDEFLSRLDPATPKFATWGNWEHYLTIDLDRIAEVFARHGCRVLDNESADVRVNGARILVTGLDSSQDGRPDVAKALRGARPSPNHLVIAHCPVQRDHVVRYLEQGALAGTLGESAPIGHAPSFVLAGHTHGGQITLGGWAPVTPVGSGRYVAGWYRASPGPLYVSRGIGETMIPARFNCPPELAVFEWELKAER
jgi:predicted MPP superfamily phosphohydrolase